MNDTIQSDAVSSAEAALAALHEQQGGLTDRLAAIEAKLPASERSLDAARLIYDAAARDKISAQNTFGLRLPSADDVWSPPSERDLDRARVAGAEADLVFEQADKELSAALVHHNELLKARGDLRMALRMLSEHQIPLAEADLRAAQEAASATTDRLAAIRARVLGA